MRWLNQTIASDERLLFVCEENQSPVGTVRLDFGSETEISWTVAPNARGRGIGSRIVELVCTGVERDIVAYVYAKNESSIRLAKQLGFKADDKETEPLRFVRHWSAKDHH